MSSSNRTESIEKMKKAAEQGNADAQLKLGELYEKGEDVEKDWAEALKWYRKAGEQGSLVAKLRFLLLASAMKLI